MTGLDYEAAINALMRRRTRAAVRLLVQKGTIRPHVMTVNVEADGQVVHRRVFYFTTAPTIEAVRAAVAKVVAVHTPVAVLTCFPAVLLLQQYVPRRGPATLHGRSLILHGITAPGLAASVYVPFYGAGLEGLRVMGPVLAREGDAGLLAELWPLRRGQTFAGRAAAGN